MKKALLAAISTCLLVSCFVAATAAAADNNRAAYTLELFEGEKLFHDVGLIPRMPGLGIYGYSIFRIPAGQKAQTANGETIYAFQIVYDLKGSTVKLEVLALLEDPDTVSEAHPMHKLRKQAAGVYEVGNGESVSLAGMADFGARPLTAKVRQEGNWF
jgi:hypothetical protein